MKTSTGVNILSRLLLNISALTRSFPSTLRFLDEVQSHCNENKMSVQNLATVFGPNILRPKLEDPVTIMEGAQCLYGGGGGATLLFSVRGASV